MLDPECRMLDLEPWNQDPEPRVLINIDVIVMYAKNDFRYAGSNIHRTTNVLTNCEEGIGSEEQKQSTQGKLRET